MKIAFYLLTFLTFVTSVSFAQNIAPDSIVRKVKDNYENEKIFIHFNQTDYRAGDTMYYKAYVMQGIFPSNKSTVLFVELISDSGKVISQQKLAIIGSTATGTIALDNKLYQGNYRLKAFTARMRNFGTVEFYEHAFSVISPVKNGKPLQEQPKFLVDFLPEGGQLISNLYNKVAFISTDQWGNPQAITGVVLNDENKEVAQFETSHNGMGYFNMVPRNNETYRAEYKIDSVKMVTMLPASQLTGALLTVNRKENGVFFQVTIAEQTEEKNRPAYLLAVEDNVVAFKIDLKNYPRGIEGKIPADKVASGIVQLTLFNSSDQPLAERLLFINNGDFWQDTKLEIKEKSLEPRKKNEINFSMADMAAGTFSLTITDADDLVASSAQDENIISQFLLSSQIKGKIYNATSYFISNKETDKENLDLVMLTHGWTKYSWKELQQNKFPSMVFKDPDFITVSGNVYLPNSDKTYPNAEMTAFVSTRDSATNLLQFSADENGYFSIPGMIFEDTATIVFKNNTTKKFKTYVGLLPEKYPSYAANYTSYKLPPQVVAKYEAFATSGGKRKVSPSYNGELLDAVILQSKIKTQKEIMQDKYTTGLLGTDANSSLDLVHDFNAEGGNSTILDFLKGRLVSVDIGNAPDYFINYRQTRNFSGPIPMVVSLDERIVSPGELTNYRVSDIALVQVFSRSYTGQTGGMLALYTRKGNDVLYDNISKATSTFDVGGFTREKTFFSPDYTSAKDQQIIRDERSTLYWNPYIILDKNKRLANFTFYNTDVTKRMKLVIQGMTDEGRLVYTEEIIE